MARQTLKYCFLIMFVLLVDSNIYSQAAVDLSNNTQREEVQRNFGYEILPYRYLSLPYDVSVNTNERAVFVDIGFGFLAFLPLLILLWLYDKKWARVLIISYLAFTWIISTSNSFVFSYKYSILEESTLSKVDYLLDESVSFLAEPTAHIAAYLYYVSNILYTPFQGIAEKFSGKTDSVTYPLMVFLCLISCWLLHPYLLNVKKRNKVLVIIFWLFLFFWIKYASGIIWYGFPLLVMGLMVILKLAQIGNPSYPTASAFLRNSFLVLSGIWVVSAIFLRFGEVHNNKPVEDLGKDMFSSVFFNYQIGEIGANEVLTSLYPGSFDKALSRMNSDTESLIYRVGTSFSYFIKNNSKRVILDNQLGLFHSIQSKYKDLDEIRNVFKASNIKYLIIDLNTPYIDKTPEKTLQTKYNRMMYFFRNAEGLKLLTTNRIIRTVDNTGKETLVYKVFGIKDLKGKDIYYGGQYAIYEII